MLQVRRHTSSSSEESMRAAPLSAKEYVESLHQNSKTQLLYGKNNVIVQPVSIIIVCTLLLTASSWISYMHCFCAHNEAWKCINTTN